VIVFLAVYSLYSVIYAFYYGIPTVVMLFRYYWDGEIVLCPPEELREDVLWATEKWNHAIQYFSLRYVLLDALKTSIRVSDDYSKCNVFFEHFDSLERCPLLGEVSGQPSLDLNTVVAYVNFTSPPLPTVDVNVTTPIKAAKIHLWRGLNTLERRAVLLHEIAVLLGIGKPTYTRQPKYPSSSDLWGSLEVTSVDIYALFLKNRYAESGGGVIKAVTPWIIPYTTVAEDLQNTILSLCISSIASIITYISLSKRWGNLG